MGKAVQLSAADTRADTPAGCVPYRRPPRHDPATLDVASGLVQLTGLVQGVYAHISERHDLTPVQARLLCVLLDGPRGMADLAQCFGVEKAALTGLMDRAERRGLAQRSAVPGDRRAIQVTLTDAGRQAALAFHADVNREIGQLADPLGAPDRERLRRAMATILANSGPSDPAGTSIGR